MKKKNLKKINYLIQKISDDSVKIHYLLNSAIYKPDENRETFILGEMAMKLSKKIYKNSSEISQYIEFG